MQKMTQADSNQKVTVYCHGGCGRSIELPETSVRDGDYFGCHLNKYGFECKAKLLPLVPGKVRITTEFTGRNFFRIRDEWPDAEIVVTTWGSYTIWAKKVAEIIVDTAKKKARGDKLVMTIRDSLVYYERLPPEME
jgi:hypothetical protein